MGDAVTVHVQDLAGDISGDFPLTRNSEDLLKEILKDKAPDEDAIYSFVMDGTKIKWDQPFAFQGVESGSSLTLVKEAVTQLVGVYTYDMKSYPEDRYSEWNDLELLPDKSCTWSVVQAGPGRHGASSTTSKTVKKKGHWSATTGGRVIVSWEGGEQQSFANLRKWCFSLQLFPTAKSS